MSKYRAFGTLQVPNVQDPEQEVTLLFSFDYEADNFFKAVKFAEEMINDIDNENKASIYDVDDITDDED